MDLLNELYDFPSAKHDDLSDAEAYGADIIVIPLAGEEKATIHHSPQDDPFERDSYIPQSFVAGNIDDDPY
jgi:hypothetical protein